MLCLKVLRKYEEGVDNRLLMNLIFGVFMVVVIVGVWGRESYVSVFVDKLIILSWIWDVLVDYVLIF